MKNKTFDIEGKLSNEEWVLKNGVSDTYYLSKLVNYIISRLDLKDQENELFMAMKRKLLSSLIDLEYFLNYKPVIDNKGKDNICADLSAMALYTAFNIKEYQFLTTVNFLDETNEARLELLEAEYLLKDKLKNYEKSEPYRKGGKIRAEKHHEKQKPVYDFIIKEIQTIKYKSLKQVANVVTNKIYKNKEIYELLNKDENTGTWVLEYLKRCKKEGKIYLDKKFGFLLAQHPDLR